MKRPSWLRLPKLPRRKADAPLGLANGGAAFVGVALAVAAMVAFVAFTSSYQHQYELNIRYGQAHWVAGMQPLSVEGLVAASTLVIWYAARVTTRRPWGAYLVLAAGVVQTALMNLAADRHYDWPWLGPEISVWPAVAFVAAYEMAVWIVRKRQAAHDATPDHGAAQPAASVPRDSLDAAIQAMLATAQAGNPLSGRQLIARFELKPPVASKVRETVLASMNGHAPQEAEQEGG